MREELHLYAKNAGAMVGPITLVDSGDEIDCARMSSGGYSIPSIVEPEIVQFKKNTAKFVLKFFAWNSGKLTVSRSKTDRNEIGFAQSDGYNAPTMRFREWFRPPRHLLAMFVGITVVSTVALAFLGWEFVRQDRKQVNERTRKDRDDATELAAAALEKHFSEVEEQLTALAAMPETELSKRVAEFSKELSGDSVFLIFRNATMEAHPAGLLLYYPPLPSGDEPPDGVFAEADALENQQKDYTRAILFLEGLSNSSDLRVRAKALKLIGRNLRLAGRWNEAVSAYERLALLEGVPVDGIPAALFARYTLSATIAEHDRARLGREAAALAEDLNRGRWPPTHSVYDTYSEKAALWLGAEVNPPPGPAAISEAAESLWIEWKSGSRLNERRTIWTANRSVLLLARSSTDRTVVLAAGPGYIESAWMADVQVRAASRGVRIAVTAEGHPVIGRLDAPRGEYISSVVSPWTVHAISNGDAGDSAVSFRSRFVMAGLFTIALLVVGGSYLIGRAVARELSVARLESDFVAAVSHEFRTPLTVLRQLSEMLAKGRVIDGSVRQQYYEVLELESTRLQRLVEGLLKFGRMEAGAIRYEFERIDSAELLRSLVADFGREAGRHGCSVELNVNDAAPPARADREALICVIWNLMDNAMKYSPDCRTVWVDLGRENGRVAIRVRDRGVGIPHEDQKRIFEKFFRGESASTLGVQGTGIGLAVVRQIVARHGGEIRLESEPGAGSAFTVLLPAAEA